MPLVSPGRPSAPAVHDELLEPPRRPWSGTTAICATSSSPSRTRRLWILQTRVGKRSPTAAFRIATDLVDEGIIDLDEALLRVSGDQLQSLLHAQFASGGDHTVLASGLAASPGASVGEVVFDSPAAVVAASRGRKVVLARPETSPDDLSGMLAAEAIVTSRGGLTSHAAVVARGMGRPCVTSLSGVEVDVEARQIRSSDGTILVREGDVVSVDGTTGEVSLGRREVCPSAVGAALLARGSIGPCTASGVTGEPAAAGAAKADEDPAVPSVLRLLDHADARRRLGVRANAETVTDARTARQYGAQGIGLARTEHMLLGDRRELVEHIVTGTDRAGALARIEELTRADFRDILDVMDGLPVVVRLLDPPLHEFLPDLVQLSTKVALIEDQGRRDEDLELLLAAVRQWHEVNPMLGLRGVRLLAVVPELLDAQVRALATAVVDLRREGRTPWLEIMVPLVADEEELARAKTRIKEVVDTVAAETGVALDVPVGCMIELPRAALTSGRMARQAQFFSFGTNDLTQTTWGISRDDAEASFLRLYREQGVIGFDPFSTLDESGVGRLIQISIAEGRAERPGLGLGICGEHGGDPASVRFCSDHGLDYVSCSPPRVPVARLEAGRAAVLETDGAHGPTPADAVPPIRP